MLLFTTVCTLIDQIIKEVMIPKRRLRGSGSILTHQTGTQPDFLPVQRPGADSAITSVEVVTGMRRRAASVHGLAPGRQGALCLQVPSWTVSKSPSGPGICWGQQRHLTRGLRPRPRPRTQRTPFLPFSVLTPYPDVRMPQGLCVCLRVPRPAVGPAAHPSYLVQYFSVMTCKIRPLKRC